MNWKQLLASTTRSVDEELRLRNAYLAVENRLLRHQITGRVQLTDAERTTLAEMGQKLGKKALAEIATIAQPETILAWHRTRLPQTDESAPPRKSVGRPRIDPVVEALVVRMARENRSWGYDRIGGALHNLGYTVSAQTVGNILKRHAIPPAPERKKKTTWNEFIHMHMAVLGATEFFSSAVWSWLRLLVSAVLSFLQGGLRKGSVAGMTFLCHGGRLRLLSLRSFDGQSDAEKGDGSAGRQRHHGGADRAHGSYNLSSARGKSLTAGPPFHTAGQGWCSCLRPTAIGDGMVPCDVDSGAARCGAMTTGRLPDGWPYSASKNNTKNFPRKQRKQRRVGDIMGAQTYVEHRDGGYWVIGTRVSLDSLVYAFREGQTAESLAQSFPVLTLEHVYGAIAYYLAHRDVIDAYLREQEVAFTQLQKDLRQRDPMFYQKLADARRQRQTTQA